MTYTISTDYNPTNLSVATLQGVDYSMSTILVRDESEKTAETIPLSQFLENNEDTFTPYETLKLIHSLFAGRSYELLADVGSVYTIFLHDICIANIDDFDFVEVTHQIDPLIGYDLVGY